MESFGIGGGVGSGKGWENSRVDATKGWDKDKIKFKESVVNHFKFYLIFPMENSDN